MFTPRKDYGRHFLDWVMVLFWIATAAMFIVLFAKLKDEQPTAHRPTPAARAALQERMRNVTPTITYDPDCQTWEATAPAGYRFASGPHLLIEPATQTESTAPAEWKRQAKRELLARLQTDSLIRCSCGECD